MNGETFDTFCAFVTAHADAAELLVEATRTEDQTTLERAYEREREAQRLSATLGSLAGPQKRERDERPSLQLGG